MDRGRLRRLALASAVVLFVLTIVGCTRVTPSIPVTTHPDLDGKACDAQWCHAATKTHKTPYTGACEDCHTLSSWRTVTYTHDNTTFNTALHGVVGCDRCHTEGQAAPDPACGTCHTVAPHGGSTKCAGCHTPLTWRMRKSPPSDHVSLKGGHADLTCFQCHTKAVPAAPRTCVDCHGSNHGGLTNCAQCHTPDAGWESPTFKHSDFFAITGKHTALQCTQCHPGGRFAETSSACVSCHGVQHGGLTACANCHTPAGFKPAHFDHATKLPLAGGPHATLACASCHPQGQFAQVKGKTCVTCHGPQHGGLTTCTPCHQANGAISSTFAHPASFPLAGGPHESKPCTSCHPDGNFPAARGKTCATCHGAPHGATVTTCTQCHVGNGALAQPLFHPEPIVLGGKHYTMGCTTCHPGNVFTNKPACESCHAAPHIGPTDCVRCHQPTVWPKDWTEMPDFLTIHPGPDVTVHDVTDFSCYDGCHIGNFAEATCSRCHGDPRPQ